MILTSALCSVVVFRGLSLEDPRLYNVCDNSVNINLKRYGSMFSSKSFVNRDNWASVKKPRIDTGRKIGAQRGARGAKNNIWYDHWLGNMRLEPTTQKLLDLEKFYKFSKGTYFETLTASTLQVTDQSFWYQWTRNEISFQVVIKFFSKYDHIRKLNFQAAIKVKV